MAGTDIWQLLRHFEFDVVNAEKPWESKNYNIWMQHEFFVRVAEREGVKNGEGPWLTNDEMGGTLEGMHSE